MCRGRLVPEGLADAAEHQLARLVGMRSRAAIEELPEGDVLATRDPVGDGVGQHLAQSASDRIAIGPGHDVCRRALKHRDVLDVGRHRRHERHRRRPGTDHHHALAAVVEIVRPALRVHDRTLEPLDAWQLGRITALVRVVPRAHEEERARDLGRVSLIGAVRSNRPKPLVGRPCCGVDVMPVADVTLDGILVGRLLQVGQDRLPTGDRLLMCPRLERVAQRVHVAVGSHPGIAEQVPRSAQPLATLEDHERPIRTLAA